MMIRKLFRLLADFVYYSPNDLNVFSYFTFVVSSHYNAAGQVEGLSSNKLEKEYVIVNKVGYDKEGHSVYTKLGNGSEARYTYYKQREFLQNMTPTI